MMKTWSLFLLLFAAVLFVGCSDDDDNTPTCKSTADTKPCTCTNGATGTRACLNSSGTWAWGGCRCLPVKKDGGASSD
jgi:hypothetical protein